MEQLVFDLYPDSEEAALRQEMAALKASTEKVRRALFARHGELAKLVLDVDRRLEVLERHLCRKTPL